MIFVSKCYSKQLILSKQVGMSVFSAAPSMEMSYGMIGILENLLDQIAPNLDHIFLIWWRFEPGSKF